MCICKRGRRRQSRFDIVEMKLETKGNTVHPTDLADRHEQSRQARLLVSLHYFSLAPTLLVFPRALVYHSGNVSLKFSTQLSLSLLPPPQSLAPPKEPLFPRRHCVQAADLTRPRDPKGASYFTRENAMPRGKGERGEAESERAVEVTADFSRLNLPRILSRVN